MSIYFNKQLPGQLWLRDLTNNVSSAYNMLSSVFTKYKTINNSFYYDVSTNNINRFDVINDTLFIETSSGYIFEKFYVDEYSVIQPYNQMNLFSTRKNTTVDYWYNESQKEIYFTEIFYTKNPVISYSIPVGTGFSYPKPASIVISPDNTKAYVANYGANTIDVINTKTNTITNTISTDNTPWGLAISSNGTKLYVSTFSNFVDVINTSTNTLLLSIPVNGSSYSLALSPDNSKLYVTDYLLASVSVINTSTNIVTNTISVGNNPTSVAVSPDGNKLYVVNYGSNSVSVINTSTYSIIKTISISNGPWAVVASLDGSKIYVGNNNSATVSIISTSNYEIINTINISSNSQYNPSLNAIALSPDDGNLYVSTLFPQVSGAGSTISVIDTFYGVITSSIVVSNNYLDSLCIAVSPNGRKVYVGNFWSGKVNVLSVNTDSLLNTFTFNLLFKKFDCSTGLVSVLLFKSIILKYLSTINWNKNQFLLENPKLTYNSDTKTFNVSFILRNSVGSFGLISLNILDLNVMQISEVNGFLPFFTIDNTNSYSTE